MNTPNFCLAILLALPVFADRSWAQNDPSSTVLIIPATRDWGASPMFSPFSRDWVWLGKRPFDLTTRKFVPEKAIFSYLPESAQHRRPEYYHSDFPQLWWEADPYTNRYYWATDDQRDDKWVVWRYDRQETRIDSFTTLSTKTPAVLGKPGIWVKDSLGLSLLDRNNGQVLSRIKDEKMDFDSGSSQWYFQPNNFVQVRDQMDEDFPRRFLRPWGDDVLFNNRWLYKSKQHRYVPFFPLPADLEDCKSPMRLEFLEEYCCSTVPGDHGFFSLYLNAPDQRALKLPFEQGSARRYLLSVDPPFAWLYVPGKLMAFNSITGDSLTYNASQTDWPLRGNQNNRYMGFSSARGLSFFDKYQCQFRVLELPAGYEAPRNFTADDRYIYLTYSNRWEIVDFSRLDTTFRRDPLAEEYKAFQEEWQASSIGFMSRFYPKYRGYMQLRDRYRNTQNPKITAALSRLPGRCDLSQERDTVVTRIAADYEAGRFDPQVSCDIAQGLFCHWGRRGDLPELLHLLTSPKNKTYIEDQQSPEYGSDLVALIRHTQQSLDSVAKLQLAPDANLYALGKIWLNYGLHSGYFIQRYDSYQSRRVGNLQPAYRYFRSLLQQYPTSPWADQAAYQTFFHLDISYLTDEEDEIPASGGCREAYRAFTQFLKNYPHSDYRPDVLLRLARVIQTGVTDEEDKKVNKNEAAVYLRTLARDYPAFNDTTANYQQAVKRMNEHAWLNDWKLETTFDKAWYKPEDTIRVSIRIYNQSGNMQTLDTAFLRHWPEGLHLRLQQVRDKGCEELWGYFPLRRETVIAEERTISVQPGERYTENFLLGHTSLHDSMGPGQFTLRAGTTYTCKLQYRHPLMNWSFTYTSDGGQLSLQ